MNLRVTVMALLISMAFVACGGGSTDSAPQEEKSTLKKTEQNISFSKYDDGYYQIGQERKYTRDNDVVTDLVTGLQWQDNNETGDPEIDADWAEAQAYCRELDLNEKRDWRLPTIHELKTLVSYQKQYPAMTEALKNIVVLPDYGHTLYWSSTVVSDDSTYAWTVPADYGGDHVYRIDRWAKVRCVRGKSQVPTYKRDEALGIVKALKTELIWQDDYRDINNSLKELDYSEALHYCESLVLAEKDDWRLPNITELYSLIDKTREYPSLDPTFKKVVASEYWSSTAEVKDDTIYEGFEDLHYQWTVDFAFGNDGTWKTPENHQAFVRCVRSGR